MLRGVRAPEVMYRSWLRSAVTWVGVVEAEVRLGFDTPLRGYSPRGGWLAVVVEVVVRLGFDTPLRGYSPRGRCAARLLTPRQVCCAATHPAAGAV